MVTAWRITLRCAAIVLVRNEHPGLPVLAADGQDVVGWLTHRAVLHAYNERLPPAQQRVMDVKWPPSSLVIAVRRNGEAFAPNGQTELRKGDRLTVLVPAEHAETLADVVHAEHH